MIFTVFKNMMKKTFAPLLFKFNVSEKRSALFAVFSLLTELSRQVTKSKNCQTYVSSRLEQGWVSDNPFRSYWSIDVKSILMSEV